MVDKNLDKKQTTKEPVKKVTAQKKTEVIEDDDLFEDFPADEWDDAARQMNKWQETWEDDENEQSEDFANLLKHEEEKRSGAQPMKM